MKCYRNTPFFYLLLYVLYFSALYVKEILLLKWKPDIITITDTIMDITTIMGTIIIMATIITMGIITIIIMGTTIITITDIITITGTIMDITITMGTTMDIIIIMGTITNNLSRTKNLEILNCVINKNVSNLIFLYVCMNNYVLIFR
ncbi:hypothetical protein JTE90_021494 [Oedothorax gibbosus]|uniref:NADH dehydrogenase subunit 6 n=1 Tax=Oedothorax gibbosus TaxID=931172 RepID=A0AAV6VN55_9ARAC|nr:hypothetical protein JTE90_021494 [Oedothorax gibbosus]